MNILIDTVRIAGFRGIKNLEVSLSRITVLIGANNSGKTSVLKAMQLALGDYSRYLSEEDFYIGSDDKRAQEILVDIRIVPVDDNGKRKKSFDEKWAVVFRDTIQAEATGNQFVALRTRCKPDPVKGGFPPSWFTLDKWLSEDWQTGKVKQNKITKRYDNIPFISIEAQRDIHQELREKSSFIGKVLSSVEYPPADAKKIEEMIKNINESATQKSSELMVLKDHLDKLSQALRRSGSTEITPLPQKIRDFSKHFSIHFSETSENSFSMEYHGMGTRSWASMLTVRAFTDLMIAKHSADEKPFFPILATEEPEAHLHPNAQKTIYRQLAESKGQVIISTHSPYLAAIANQSELRYLNKCSDQIEILQLSLEPGTEAYRRLRREVIYSRGEIIFSDALVLCEGETEEQVLPKLFQKYFDFEAFMLGVNFIGVGGSGKKYLPFLTLARDFSIPVFILSDGEESTTNSLKACYEAVFGATDITNCPSIIILDNADFEAYLIASGYKSAIESAIKELDGDNFIDNWIVKKDNISAGREKTDSPPCITCKQNIYVDIIRNYKTSDGYEKALIDILDSSKTKYAPKIAEKLCELEPKDFPPKLIELFERIKAGALI